ncbi:hypothetical protein UFOVP778_15 [uncultured Caudovirales phage]|uniref:Uncharacterized protein n=1 Tax=uncultured Caudovirales phage TaxID=2100421 RepID=A0A6J5NY02_9CAUD|nr:hypothetical protein UFOVP778_15 [uncultured Caudovirales phage]
MAKNIDIEYECDCQSNSLDIWKEKISGREVVGICIKDPEEEKEAMNIYFDKESLEVLIIDLMKLNITLTS